MSSQKHYTPEYIADCHSKIEEDISAFRKLDANQEFECRYFNNLVLKLEMMFVNRSRTMEGKDGNVLNEVRLIAASLLTPEEKLLQDQAIRYDEQSSVLKISVDEKICINMKGFKLLNEAYFREINAKYSVAADA